MSIDEFFQGIDEFFQGDEKAVAFFEAYIGWQDGPWYHPRGVVGVEAVRLEERGWCAQLELRHTPGTKRSTKPEQRPTFWVTLDEIEPSGRVSPQPNDWIVEIETLEGAVFPILSFDGEQGSFPEGGYNEDEEWKGNDVGPMSLETYLRTRGFTEALVSLDQLDMPLGVISGNQFCLECGWHSSFHGIFLRVALEQTGDAEIDNDLYMAASCRVGYMAGEAEIDSGCGLINPTPIDVAIGRILNRLPQAIDREEEIVGGVRIVARRARDAGPCKDLNKTVTLARAP